jgi:hypothetical protein
MRIRILSGLTVLILACASPASTPVASPEPTKKLPRELLDASAPSNTICPALSIEGLGLTCPVVRGRDGFTISSLASLERLLQSSTREERPRILSQLVSEFVTVECLSAGEQRTVRLVHLFARRRWVRYCEMLRHEAQTGLAPCAVEVIARAGDEAACSQSQRVKSPP